jgi:small subunit ribosomal protein S2
MQAEADKDVEEESEIAVASADLKPGERKVISNGTEGPVVEIIRKTEAEQEAVSDEDESVEDLEPGTEEPKDRSEEEIAGE